MNQRSIVFLSFSKGKTKISGGNPTEIHFDKVKMYQPPWLIEINFGKKYLYLAVDFTW